MNANYLFYDNYNKDDFLRSNVIKKIKLCDNYELNVISAILNALLDKKQKVNIMLKMIICDDKIFCSSFEDLVIELCRERNLKYKIIRKKWYYYRLQL